jgi:hypothetical protein
MNEKESSKKKRHTRSDKGHILATERDQHILHWIADQWVIRRDHIRVLLTREPGKPLLNPKISEYTVDAQIQRWKHAGWIKYERLLAHGPGWAWITKGGLRQIVDNAENYNERHPSLPKLERCHALNQIRLDLEEKGKIRAWESHSRITDAQIGTFPDAALTLSSGEVVALVIALTESTEHLTKRLDSLFNARGIGDKPAYKKSYLYVPASLIKDHQRNVKGSFTQIFPLLEE